MAKRNFKPILYPFKAEVYDERTQTKVSLGHFRTALDQSKVFSISSGDDVRIHFVGYYKYMFCTVNDVISYFNLVHRWNPMYDPLTKIEELDRNSKTTHVNDRNVKLTFNKGVNVVTVPFNSDEDEKLRYRLSVIEIFLREYCLNRLPPNTDLDDRRFNIFTFFYYISSTLQSKLPKFVSNTPCFIMDDWETSELRFAYEQDTYLHNLISNDNDDPCFTTHHVSKDLVFTLNNNNLIDDYTNSYSFDVDWYPCAYDQITDVIENKYEYTYIGMHYTFTFNFFHVHVFPDFTSFLHYYLDCLRRTYSAQFKFQTAKNQINVDRRGTYAVLINNHTLRALKEVFGFNPQCLFGVPSYETNLINVPTKTDKFIDTLKQYYHGYIKGRYSIDQSSTLMHMYKTMYNVVKASVDKHPCMHLDPDEVIIYNDPVMTYANVEEIDPNTNRNIDIIEYSNATPLYLDINQPLIMARPPDAEITLSYRYREFHYDNVISIPTGILCDFTTDDDKHILRLYRLRSDIRSILKNTFYKLVKPSTIARMYLSQEMIQNLTDKDNLFYTAYVYSDPVNYSLNNGILTLASGALISKNFNKVNSSTFKLYALIWKYYIEPDLTLLNQTTKILLLGATDEPNVTILRNLTQHRWDVSGIGSDAVSPNLRSNVFSMLVGDKANVVVSDIDVSYCKTVDEINVKLLELLDKVITIASDLIIFKIEYSLISTLMQIRDYMQMQFFFVKSVGTRPGSSEIFLIGFPKQTLVDNYTDTDIRHFVANNSVFLDDKISTDFTTFYKLLNLNKLNGDDILGNVVSFYANEDTVQNAISVVSTVCDITSVGKMTDIRSNKSDGLVKGMVSIDRVALYCRRPEFYLFSNHLQSRIRLNGKIDPSTFVLKNQSPATCFTNSQRYALSLAYDYLQRAIPNMEHYDVLDVGARNFTGVIFGRKFEHRYVAYDKKDVTLIPNRDLTFVHKDMKLADVSALLNEKVTVIAYNSFFMGYNDNDSLYKDLVSVLTNMCDESVLIFSLYVCDRKIAASVISNKIGRAVAVPNGGPDVFNCSLGAYDPVASLTPTQVNDLLFKKAIKNLTLTVINVSHTTLYNGALVYGRSPNPETHYLLPLLNSFQVSFLAHKHPGGYKPPVLPIVIS
nr:130KD protein [Fijivirus sp.]